MEFLKTMADELIDIFDENMNLLGTAMKSQAHREGLWHKTFHCWLARRYCMPCPYGINIPAIFAHYNKCLKDDNVSRDTRDPHYNSARRAFLVGYDRTVPKLRQADRCIACGECVHSCPQSIAIPARLKDISDYVNRLKAGKA